MLPNMVLGQVESRGRRLMVPMCLLDKNSKRIVMYEVLLILLMFRWASVSQECEGPWCPWACWTGELLLLPPSHETPLEGGALLDR